MQGRDLTEATLKGPFIHLATCQQVLRTYSVLSPALGAGNTRMRTLPPPSITFFFPSFSSSACLSSHSAAFFWEEV